jgi:hypothetical protein
MVREIDEGKDFGHISVFSPGVAVKVTVTNGVHLK